MSSLQHFKLENELNENRNDIIGKFTKFVNDKLNTNISLENLAIYIKTIIELVEKSKFENSNKMKFSLLILKELINKLPDTDNKIALSLMLENKTIENIIELILDASKNKLKLNKKKFNLFNCF